MISKDGIHGDIRLLESVATYRSRTTAGGKKHDRPPTSIVLLKLDDFCCAIVLVGRDVVERPKHLLASGLWRL